MICTMMLASVLQFAWRICFVFCGGMLVLVLVHLSCVTYVPCATMT